MSLHIVIDGYNLIRQSSSLGPVEQHESMEEGRQALLEKLASYKKFKDYHITVVFDGAGANANMVRRTRWKGVDIVFSHPGQLADTVIKDIVIQERERVVVVTSDKEVADFAAEYGAATIDSVEFEDKMHMAIDLDSELEDFSEEEERSWVPTTKKKGPSHRRSKRERRNRVKTKKL